MQRHLLIALIASLGVKPAYTQNPAEYRPDPNTVLLLHMNETSGSTVSDASGNGNNGTATGTTIVDGRFGKARSFNGSSNYVDLPTSLNPPYITLEAWIYPTGFGGSSDFISVINKVSWQGQPIYNSWRLGIERVTQKAEIMVSNGGSTHGIARSTTILQANRWYHIAGTFDGSAVKVYVNGVLETSTPYTGVLNSTSTGTSIGASNVSGWPTFQYFTGSIDEVRISNIVRSPSKFNLQLPPKSLTASASGTAITLNWQNGGGAVGLLRYKIYRDTDSTTTRLIDSTTSTLYTNFGLTAGTRYFYRVSAVDSTGFEGAKSDTASATTGSAPLVTTNATSSVSSTSATLNGSVNPNGLATTAYFEWGTSSTLVTSTATASQSIGLGTSTVSVTANLTGLSLGTYFYRIVAQNSAGIARGSILSFTTVAASPAAFADSVSNVTSSSAVLWGRVNPFGSLTRVWFIWGTNASSLTNSTPQRSTGSGNTTVTFSDTLRDLSPSTIYYFRLVSENSGGQALSSIQLFTTSATPVAKSLYVSISGNDANAGTAAAPLRNIQTALTRASSGDTIKVASGTYVENLTTAVKVILRGGYDATFSESARNLIRNKTVVKPSSGTMLSDGNSSTVDGFVFDGSGGAGKGVLVTAGNSTITHNVVQGVSASGGSCFEVASTAAATIKNNTAANNILSGGGVIVYSFYIKGNAGAIVVQNNIAYNNNVGFSFSASGVTAGYNCAFGNTYQNFDVVTAGGTDLVKDPKFVNAANGDFRLKASSPCINAGNPSDAVGAEPSPNGNRIDIGAYGGTGNATPNGNPTTYVATSGNDANAGSISAPYKTIQAAINSALGDTVKVATGSYSEGIIASSQAILLGGYDNTFAESKRDIFANRTTLVGVSTTMIYDRYGSTFDGLFLDGNAVAQTGFDISTGSKVTHTVLINISAGFGYGIMVSGNATVTNNTLLSITRALTIQSGAAGTSVRNNIFANNTFALINNAANGIAKYNGYFGNSFNYTGSFATPGTGDLAVNPQFRSTSTNDYRLASNSPCIDAGDPTDPVGNEPAPNNTRIDMGAYGGTKNAGGPAASVPKTITLTSGSNQSGKISTALANPFVVTVTDSAGTPVSGVSVTFAIATLPTNATGQSLSATSTTTNSSGQASTILTVGNKVGTYTVTATSTGLTGNPVTFTATATVGSATTITASSGSGQSGSVSKALANPFVVTVTDAGGNLVQGTSVTFAVTAFPSGATGHSLNPTSATTNSGGQASTVLTLGSTIGTYTVQATSTGLSGSPVTFTATATAIAAPATPTLSSPANGATNQPTTLTLSWNVATGATSYRLQVSTNQNFTTTVLDDSTITGTSRQIGPLANNSVYYWRVNAKNSGGTSPFTPASNFSTVATTTVAMPTPLSFPPSPTSSTDYRLVSIPGAGGVITVGDILSGAQKVDWRVYQDNGAASNFLVELSSGSSFSTGEGYWFLKKGTLNISRTVTLPSVGTDGMLSIPLHAGWNIIGNPFEKSVQWSAVKNANGLSASLLQPLAYNGSYVSSSTIEPFSGYYFDNRTADLSQLKIPYPFGSLKIVSPAPPRIDWKLQLVFESDINADRENYIGIAPSSAVEQDEMDIRKPPLFLDQGFLYFDRPRWDSEYCRFAGDFRPTLGDGQVWDFEVKNPRLSQAKITVRGVEQIPAEYDITLLNFSNSVPVNVRMTNEYSYQTVSERMQFKLIVGKKSFVQAEVQRLVPESFSLDQNYPNPFNPSTSITFRAPRSSYVRLELYSLLGQRIITLVDGSVQAGVHTVLWNAMDESGQPVASGIYIYKITAEGFAASKKMVLLR